MIQRETFDFVTDETVHSVVITRVAPLVPGMEGRPKSNEDDKKILELLKDDGEASRPNGEGSGIASEIRLYTCSSKQK